MLLNTKYLFSFPTNLFEISLILRRNQVTNVHRSACRVLEYPLFFSDFNDTSTFSNYFMKFPPVGAELFHAEGRRTDDGRRNRYRDRQTDMTHLIVDFRNFSKAPKIILRHRVFLCYCHVSKNWRGLFKFDLPSREVSTHHELGHVPQTRPTRGAQSFSPHFSLSMQLLCMCDSGCAYV